MTAHEVFTSLFLLVAGGYVVFVGWFAWAWISSTRAGRRSRARVERDGAIGATTRR